MAATAFQCPPPAEFTFAEPSEWPKWQRRFLRFHSVSGLKEKDVSDQIDALIYLMGEKAETILAALHLSSDDSQNFDKVLAAFDRHFIGRRNVIYERACFNRRVQQEGESVDEFITDCHALAKHCDYGPLHDELLRDKIVIGVRDRQLSSRMQMDGNLTLEKATQIARQAESIQRQQAVIHQDVDYEQVNRVKRYSPYSRQTSFQQRRAVPRRQGMSTNNVLVCYFCGGRPHSRKECPAKRSVCNACGKVGHWARRCQSKSKVHEVRDATKKGIKHSFLGAISIAKVNSTRRQNATFDRRLSSTVSTSNIKQESLDGLSYPLVPRKQEEWDESEGYEVETPAIPSGPQDIIVNTPQQPLRRSSRVRYPPRLLRDYIVSVPRHYRGGDVMGATSRWRPIFMC